MSEEKTTVNIMPEWSNTPFWVSMIDSMITGHNKHLRRKINALLKNACPNGSAQERMKFFSDAALFARDEKEFWETIEQTARYERQVEEIKDMIGMGIIDSRGEYFQFNSKE